MLPIVRQFEPRDRRRVREISYATAFPGALPGRRLRDPELIADLLTLYYTDREPASALVAEVDGKIAGYLIGALSTRRYRREMVRIIRTVIIPNILQGKYRLGRKAFILGLIGAWGLLRDAPAPDIEERFPAHLHVNIDAPYRDRGIGSRLMEAWLDRIREKGARGVFLATNSSQAKAIAFFQKCGFETVFRARSTFYSYVNGRPTDREIMARALGPAAGSF